MFGGRMGVGLPWAAAAAAARFVKGGQITIPACSDFSTNGRNFSKNCVVSAGVLYIFQLPAMIGFLIGFVVKSWRVLRSMPQNWQPPSGGWRKAARETPDRHRP